MLISTVRDVCVYVLQFVQLTSSIYIVYTVPHSVAGRPINVSCTKECFLPFRCAGMCEFVIVRIC